MSALESSIPSLVIGGLTILLGLYMAISGNARLLHSYHYTNVPPEQMPRLARETGTCTALLGAGIALLGLSGSILPTLMVIPGVLLLVGGIVGMLASIVRRNGALIAFAAVTPASLKANRASVIAIVAVCVLIACIPIGLGVYMMTTGDVSSLHSYHREGIAAADLPSFALVQGLCLIALGLAIPLAAVGGLGLAARPMPVWARILTVLGVLLFAGGLIGLLLSIPAFGGSLTP